MFEDPKSRRSHRLFRLRSELMLGGVSRDVRRQLLEDLTAHLVEVVEHSDPTLPECVRVDAAISRIGDPREFLAPLIRDAVMIEPVRVKGGSWRAVAYAALRGGRQFGEALSIAFSLGIGTVLAIAAAGALIFPRRIGLFHLSGDEYQLRLFSSSEIYGAPIFHPWFSIFGLLVGASLVFSAWRRSRRLAAAILASEREMISHNQSQSKE